MIFEGIASIRKPILAPMKEIVESQRNIIPCRYFGLRLSNSSGLLPVMW